ncbi:MAG: TatD family hydrolase [Candidatus Peribacteria bacterium]|nr:TatD family hydrolase [Candidatus Peribacteria bacterium]
MKATLGFHPEDAKNISRSDFSALMEQLKQQYTDNPEEIIAIGECGIDLYRVENPDIEHQQILLRLQAELARKLHLPLVIHSREGFEETLEVLQEFTDLKIYFHCWGYGPEELLKLETIFPQIWFGFTNILSYPSAQKTRDSLLVAKREHLLLETDAPFLPPQVFRGQKNYPAYVSYVYQKTSELLDISLTDLENLIEDNFTVIFP